MKQNLTLPLRVLLLGVGHDHAPVIFDAIARQGELFSVVALAVPDGERTRYRERIATYETLFSLSAIGECDIAWDTVDAVLVESEEKDLVRLATLAAMQDKPVHMDKPCGLSYSDFCALIALVKEKALPFQIGYMYRQNPCVKEALRRIRAGELGRIYGIHAEMSCEHPKEKRAWLCGLPGGMMFYLGCHMLDLILQIQGKPLSVTPLLRSTSPDVGVDYAVCAYEYEGGTTLLRTTAVEAGGFMERRLSVYGEKGTLHLAPIEAYDFENAVDGRDSYATLIHIPAGGGWCATGTPERTALYNRYTGMTAHFAKMAVGEAEPLVSYDYEKELCKLLFTSIGVNTEEDTTQ